jgi:pimeloyl-ACP methyl ester carboxylesterase
VAFSVFESATQNLTRKLETGMFDRFAIFTIVLCAAVVPCTPNLQAQKSGVKNIILVHGAWADGSGGRGVYDNLVRDGFNVSIVQEPETSFHDDVTAVRRILAPQDGQSIVVAHSYGGAVITEAGTDPSVAGLVYVAAHMPDAGENEADDGKRFPSDLSKSGAIKKTADGFTYLDPAQFHEGYKMPAGYSFNHGVIAASPAASFTSAMDKILRNTRVDVNASRSNPFS